MCECLYTAQLRMGRSVVVCRRPTWYGGSGAGWICDRCVEQPMDSTTRAGHVVPYRDGGGWPCPCMYVFVRWAVANIFVGSSRGVVVVVVAVVAVVL